MFYDHKILTERKYGIATVWLVATLGNKTTLAKKVQKKEILDVDLNKACDTILNPEAPLALRLQSNLLYGVSRVYREQYHYFYSDVNTAHSKLSKEALMLTMQSINLGKDKMKGGENLLLEDDPAFVPKLSLMAKMQELNKLLGIGDISSTMSPSPGLTTPSSANRRILELAGSGKYQLAPPSSSISGGGGFGLADFGNEDISFQGSGLAHEVEFLGDVDFEFDEDGQLREIEPVKRPRSRSSQLEDNNEKAKRPRIRRSPGLASDDMAQQMVMDDLGGGLRAVGDLNNDYDFEMPNFDMPDNGAAYDFLNASPLPERQQQEAPNDPDFVLMDVDESSVSIQQAKNRRARQIAKKTAFDAATMIPQKTLAEWQMNYVDMMAAQNNKKQQSKRDREAKAAAKSFVMEIKGLPTPLAGLNEMLKDFVMQNTGSVNKGGDGKPGKKKIGSGPDDAGRQVDMQMDDVPQPFMDDGEIGLGGGDDIPQIVQDVVQTPAEIGRRDSNALADSVAVMPWNMSGRNSRAGSVFSVGGGIASSSIGGNLLSSNRRPFSRPPLSRLGSQASPLVGRGAQFNEGDDANWDIHLSSPRPADEDLIGLDKFEYYGRADNEETQDVQATQWVRGVLEQEGKNFLGYLQNKIEELNTAENDEIRGEDEVDEITFEKLVDPKENSSIVAAQAFHHTLSLATKGLLKLRQEEAFGNIIIQLAI